MNVALWNVKLDAQSIGKLSPEEFNWNFSKRILKAIKHFNESFLTNQLKEAFREAKRFFAYVIFKRLLLIDSLARLTFKRTFYLENSEALH